MDSKPTLHILLADDQANVRSALRLLLEQEPGIAIVGEAADATGASAHGHRTPGQHTAARLGTARSAIALSAAAAA